MSATFMEWEVKIVKNILMSDVKRVLSVYCLHGVLDMPVVFMNKLEWQFILKTVIKRIYIEQLTCPSCHLIMFDHQDIF